jgi:TonB-dependent starch-binding outer membrane protein SusC
MKKFSPSKKMFWKVMRLTFVQLILIGVSCSVAVAKPVNGQDVLNKAVTFKVQSLPVKNILSEIEKQTNVKFVYSDTRIKVNKQVTVDAPNQKLALVLNNLFNPLSIHYQVSGNYIVLTKAKNNASTENRAEKAAFVITGKVLDERTGESIVGASVLLKGTSKGALTDDTGAYTLAIGDDEKNGTLVFSFVGYESQNVAINGNQVVNVKLKEGKNLEEVVVTGVFDARTRLEASSAISIMKTQDIERARNRVKIMKHSLTNLHI